MSHEELRQRWRTDFAALRADIDAIFLNRQVYRRLADSLRAAEGSSIVDDYLRRSYLSTQTIVIRRLSDTDNRSVSLANILVEMSAHAPALTRAAYLDLAPAANAIDVNQRDDIEKLARERNSEDFDRIAGGPNVDHVPTDVFEQYRADLERLSGVNGLVNKQIAHRDRTPSETITWGELDEAIDDLETHLNNIGLILDGRHHASSELSIVGDWFTPFAGDAQ